MTPLQPFSDAMPGVAGKVFLVGAGPGDPELITLRGLRVLRRADVLVYDRLVHPELIVEAPEWAERRFVGKAPGLAVMRQDEINALLVDRARRGFTVVRLKGGDPFVFGRGSEEAAALTAAGIAWEVVPAVSSALAAPALAGIPVTHREVAASFAVVTGHRSENGAEPDWGALARIDTLVVLMGVGELALIAARLLAGGRAATTPVAIIERASLPEERVVIGTLDEIAFLAHAAGVRSPATIVIGEVVAQRERLTQPASAPLPFSALIPPALLPHPETGGFRDAQ